MKEKKENKQIGVYYRHQLSSGKVVLKKQIKLGIDQVSGKPVLTTVTANSVKELRLAMDAKKREFADNGMTALKEVSKCTFSQLADEYLSMYEATVKTGTYKNVKGMVETYLKPAFGQLRVDKITPIIVQKVVNEWIGNANEPKTGVVTKKGKGKQYMTYTALLKDVFRYGIAKDYLALSPAEKVRAKSPKKNKEKKVAYFTREQSQRLLKGLVRLYAQEAEARNALEVYNEKLLSVFLRLLLLSGLRTSEALCLNWADVDDERCLIRVTKTLDGKGVVQNTPKTKASIRNVVLDEEMLEVLENWKVYQQTASLQRGIAGRDFVFSSIVAQRPVSRQMVLYKAKELFKALKLPALGLHALRHTHASLLLNVGVPYKEIQMRLGHEDIKTTMDTYGHLFETIEAELLEKLTGYMDEHYALAGKAM